MIEPVGPLIGAPDNDPDWRPFAFTHCRVFDLGYASVSLPTEILYRATLENFAEQLAGRYGEQNSPAGEDIIGPYDFVTGIRPHELEPWVFYDHSPTNLFDGWRDLEPDLPFLLYPPNTDYEVPGKIHIRFRVYANGEMQWHTDPNWIGGGNVPVLSNIITGSMTAALGILFWPSFLFGDCGKDRNLLVNLRGRFEAARSRNRAVVIGIYFEPKNGLTGGTWAALQPWSARPICNNRRETLRSKNAS